MPSEDPRPRLSVTLTEEQKMALDKAIGGVYGLQRAIFSAIVDDLIRILSNERLKQRFISAVISRQIGLEDWIKGVDEDGT